MRSRGMKKINSPRTPNSKDQASKEKRKKRTRI
jgi:hypothetical protein